MSNVVSRALLGSDLVLSGTSEQTILTYTIPGGSTVDKTYWVGRLQNMGIVYQATPKGTFKLYCGSTFISISYSGLFAILSLDLQLRRKSESLVNLDVAVFNYHNGDFGAMKGNGVSSNSLADFSVDQEIKITWAGGTAGDSITVYRGYLLEMVP